MRAHHGHLPRQGLSLGNAMEAGPLTARFWMNASAAWRSSPRCFRITTVVQPGSHGAPGIGHVPLHQQRLALSLAPDRRQASRTAHLQGGRPCPHDLLGERHLPCVPSRAAPHGDHRRSEIQILQLHVGGNRERSPQSLSKASGDDLGRTPAPGHRCGYDPAPTGDTAARARWRFGGRRRASTSRDRGGDAPDRRLHVRPFSDGRRERHAKRDSDFSLKKKPIFNVALYNLCYIIPLLQLPYQTLYTYRSISYCNVRGILL